MAITLIGLAIASLMPQSYVLEMSGGREFAYISGMYAVEDNGVFSYRWTSAKSEIRIPNIPSQALRLTLKFAGPGLDVVPTREASLSTDAGVLGNFPVHPGLQEVSLQVPPESVVDGDLTLKIRVEPFSTPTDPRRLGIALVSVRLDPEGPAGSLPWRHMVLVAASIAAIIIAALVSGVGAVAAVALGGLLAVAATLLQAADRPALGLFGWQALEVAVAGLLIVALGRLALQRWRGFRLWDDRETAWMLLASVLVLMVFLLGVSYPQFATSDLMMHVHNLEGVLRGDLFFTEALPGGRPAPYPPAYYLFLVPAALAYTDLARLILIASSALMASSVLLLWMASRAVSTSGWAGILGGWLYALSPVNFLLMSAGNHTNVFGQWVALILFVALLAIPPKLFAARPMYLIGLECLVLIGLLSHLGVAQALLLCLGLYVVGLFLVHGPWRRRDGMILGLGILGAGLIAFTGYYLRFMDVFKNLAAYAASADGVQTSGVPRREIPIRVVSNLWTSAGPLSVLMGPWGVALASASRLESHRVIVMLAWAIGGVIYGVGNVLTRTQGRNALFVLAPLALGVGWIAVQWVRRGWPGTLTAAALVGLVTWYGLYDWAMKVLYAYH